VQESENPGGMVSTRIRVRRGKVQYGVGEWECRGEAATMTQREELGTMLRGAGVLKCFQGLGEEQRRIVAGETIIMSFGERRGDVWGDWCRQAVPHQVKKWEGACTSSG